MREVVKSYTKMVRVGNSGSVKDPVDVSFVDSEGTTLKSNFVKVEALSGAGSDEWFLVVPSPTNAAQAASDTSAASGLDNIAGSATPGAIGKSDTGIVTLSVYKGDEMTGIRLSHSSSRAVRFAVTYGVVSPSDTSTAARRASGN